MTDAIRRVQPAGLRLGAALAGLALLPGRLSAGRGHACLACHSRRQAMQDGLPIPGTDDHDAYSITPLREGVFHPDGSILGEAFEGGSFLQSKTQAKGVRCSTCHEPNGSALRAEGNAVCTQCHSPAGAPDYPSLALRVHDGPEHHFHAGGGEGARCVACHMIERVFMGADPRRDHSFRIPRPDLAETGSPDACTDCQADRGDAWVAAELSTRFPDSAHRGPHFATVFAAARREPGSATSSLLEIAEAAGAAGIVRATARELLGVVENFEVAERVALLLEDPDPLVRAAAAGPLRCLPPEDRLALLAPLRTDRLCSVREAAATALADARSRPGAPGAAALVSARREWREALAARADFPQTHLQIGGAALQSRDFNTAPDAFERAAALDPQIVQAWSMVVRLKAAMRNTAAAQDALACGLKANPGNRTLLSLR